MTEEITITDESDKVCLNEVVEYMGESFVSHEVDVASENEISFVIPVYREFENGNMVKLIENLLHQNIDTNKFECIFLVNDKKSSDEKTEIAKKLIKKLLDF